MRATLWYGKTLHDEFWTSWRDGERESKRERASSKNSKWWAKWHICIDHQLAEVDAHVCVMCLPHCIWLGLLFLLDWELNLRFPLAKQTIDDKFSTCSSSTVGEISHGCIDFFFRPWIVLSTHFAIEIFIPMVKIW